MGSLDHITPSIKTGQETLSFNDDNLNITLLDFWKWSVSDILSNATRGRFAEFLVANALEIDVTKVREEWGAYDLLTSDGIKIEVKSAAYLQSWQQKVFSLISFSVKPAREWDWVINKRSTIIKRHADVYVFCLLKHQDKQTVNPLNLDHWDFYVLSTSELGDAHSISLNSLQKITSPISYGEIKIVVTMKHNLSNKTDQT